MGFWSQQSKICPASIGSLYVSSFQNLGFDLKYYKFIKGFFYFPKIKAFLVSGALYKGSYETSFESVVRN